MKKILALVLCVFMIVAILGGCNSKPAASSDEKADDKPAASEKADEKEDADAPADAGEEMTAAEKAIADRKASGEDTKIVLSLYTWVGRPAGTDRISKALSKHTSEALGIEVELLPMDSASYKQNIPLMITGGEQVDIISSNSVGFMTCVTSDYIIDMYEDNLIQDYGQNVTDVLQDWILPATTVDGKLYAVPPNKDHAAQCGILCFGRQYMDGIGYDYDSKWINDAKDSIDSSWEEVEPIMAELAKKYPDKYVFSATSSYLGQGLPIDPLNNDYYGVLLDIDKPEVSDLWSSDLWMETCERFHKYNQLGYYPPDALTSTVSMGARVGAGECMSMISMGKPGYRAQSAGECSMDVIPFEINETIVKSACSISSCCLSITSCCEDPIAAMQLLDHLYICPECENIYLWGEEGIDYKKCDDGRITFADGVDYQNAEWYHTCSWEMPNMQIGYIWNNNTLDLYDRMKEFNENAHRSCALGFLWDNTEYAATYTALENVRNQYYKGLILGFSDPKTTIPEMIEAFKAAGFDEYFNAKKAAFDEWYANK